MSRLKTRSGLVSNSSTSSFILIGYPKPDLDDDIFLRALGLCPEEMDDCEKDEYFWETHDECDCMADHGNGKIYIGRQLAYWGEEDSLQTLSIDISRVVMEVKDIGEKLGIKEEPKLFFGTVSC